MPVPKTSSRSLTRGHYPVQRWHRIRRSRQAPGRTRTGVIPISAVLIITSLLMILLVLLHKGKGGGLSDLFGGGVSSTLGSSSVVERNLDRITIFFGVLWFICVVALGWLVQHPCT